MLNMEDKLKYFEKYIIKKVVNMVGYSPERDEYDFNHIHLTDDMMQEIEAEGRRYGIQDTELQQVITQTLDHIRVDPSVNVKYGNITLESLKTGQHLRLKIVHPEKGEHHIDMLVLQPEKFFVLSSDISGLVFEDVLVPMDKVWNATYNIDFMVMRSGKQVPNSVTTLHLEKFESVEFYTPSLVHEIMDADNTFTYADLKSENLQENVNAKWYYLWMPVGWSPVRFRWQEGDSQDVNSPFIVIDNEEEQESNLMVNTKFSFTDKSEGIDQLLSILMDCCVCRNGLPSSTRELKGIKTVKYGTLKKDINELYSKEWSIVAKPQIKFIYDE